jgi:hypothetical protein
MELEVDIINAATYEDICDYSIIPPDGKYFVDEILERDAIIFCKTDFIDYLFSNLSKSINNYVIITHHSDYPIDNYRFSMKPDSVKKWFAINPIIKSDSLVCIPLGLKTHKGSYLEEKYMTKWFIENINKLKNNQKENKVYCNWTNTNPYRMSIINKLENNKIDFVLESNLSFDTYAENMSMCKFVISPPGNGIDCHRTWESLYLGCIPIVIKNSIYDEWTDLPILQVNDYSEVDNNLLNSFAKKQFNYEKLYFQYWKKIIKESL